MEKFPENTEIAFEEALSIGSQGLETGMSGRVRRGINA